MKKFVTALVAIVLLLPMFAACKKTQTTNSEKKFSDYFPTAVINTGEQQAQSTQNIFGQKQAYRSITFHANTEQTNNLESNYLKIDFIANQNTNIDFIISITTNGAKTEYPLVAIIKDKKGSTIFNPNITFSNETEIKIALTIPGGNGVNGLLFSQDNAITGFTWGITQITLKTK